MQKGGMQPRSIAIMVAFALSCFGLLLFLWLSFGGPIPLKPKGYRVTAEFSEATTLATEADVRISGVPIGKVKTVSPDRTTGLSDVVMEIQPRYAPLPSDVKATLRQKTLLGETYVELTPGTKGARTITEGGRIPDSAIAQSVQLDEIFRAFDPKTRAAFQTWMQEQSQAIGPYARDVNAALGNLGPFADDTAKLVGILRRQQAAVQGLVSNTGTVFGALSQRQGQLQGMIRNLDSVFRTTGRRDRELQQSFVALPTFEREARTTLKRLDRFANNANPLVTQLRPAARQLSPTLRDLKAISPDLKALFRDLNPLITASRTGFPATQRLLDELRPFLGQLHPAMQQLLPILQFLAPYKRELTAFFANTVGATQAVGSVGTKRVHYLRTANPVNPEILAAYPRRIGSNRPNAYALPGAFDKLAGGMEFFETRQCGRGVPVISQLADPLLVSALGQSTVNTLASVFQPATGQTQTPAPACKQQGDFTFQGKTSQYPRVDAAP
ncbi:MAG: phospholipid/cholesterol/gamma-HCH transport system substrate-binding protein [Solirubrobacteraceae bacterium]|jgi:virulence factor Mce-like protein|nr:phospholipid/cholesterol/gamma-HCH transport system substrate-binding protein [Solirubrobacteraceae bacterium]